MANQTTTNSGAVGGHEQSIGSDSPAPVDGIAGSHPGTQEPSGAHVDAGGPAGGPAVQPESGSGDPQARPLPRPTPVGGLAGMSGQGVAHPKGATGALGSHARQRTEQASDEGDPMYAGNWTGSVARGGKSVGVYSSSGSLSRQHSSRG